MSVEQGVFALAGAVCVLGSIVAVAHRDPRVAGAALLLTLLSLGALYATLSAPVVAGLVVLVTLIAVVPLVVHLTVPAPRDHPIADGPPHAGTALLIGAALFGLALAAIAAGELPLNVSLRSTDGYDIAGLYALLAGRMGVAALAVGAAIVAALATARAAGRTS
jgi:NADH:ubiquinone oxidoreductase subunit 6 (subunit J)